MFQRIILKLPVWDNCRLVVPSLCRNNYMNSFMEIVAVQFHLWGRWVIFEFVYGTHVVFCCVQLVYTTRCSILFQKIILKLLVWNSCRLVISSLCLNNYMNSFMEIVAVQLHLWGRWAICEFVTIVLA